MARVVSSAFEGVPPRDVIADASIYERTMRRAIGEIAEIADRITGQNSNAVTIDHRGGGRGCPLGLPLVNQTIDQPLWLTDGGSAVEGNHYVIGAPIFVPVGAGGAYTLEVDAVKTEGPVNGPQFYVEIYDGSWSIFFGSTPGVAETYETAGRPPNDGYAPPRTISDEPVPSTGADLKVWRWTVALGEGLQYLVVRTTLYTQANEPAARLHGWRLFPDRTFAARVGADPPASTTAGSPYPAHSTLTPSTWVDFYDHQIYEDAPLDAYVMSRANKNINALWELLTGSKVQGNQDYQCSTTRDHSRASFSAEPLLEFPLAVWAVGGVVSDDAGLKPAVSPMSAAAPTSGLVNWSRYPQTQTGTVTVARGQLFFPSFAPASVSLTMAILVQAPNGDSLASWQARYYAVSWVAFTQLGTSDYWVAVVTGTYTPSSSKLLAVQMSHTGGGALAHEVAVMGIAWYFDP